jgi:tetratricopeptide (TPR) repeat protein
VVGIVEERGGRIAALRRNLDEQPSHDPSIAALTEVLTAKASPDELAEFLASHAERLEAGGDRERAVRLWSQHAELSERLGDVPRAISSHRRVVALEPGDIAALDAIARLFIARGESAEAVPWLQQRLERTPAGSERAVIVLQLADALLAAGKTERAIQVLARSVAEDPKEPRTREILLRLYRDAQAWEPLAALLQSAAHHIEDRAQLLSYFYEAAAIFRDRLDASDRAIPVLEQLRALVPDDAACSAASPTRCGPPSGSPRPARSSRRCSPTSAAAARPSAPPCTPSWPPWPAPRATASRRWPSSSWPPAWTSPTSPALQMLAELSQEDGDLARAERTYRALLLAARRRPIATDDEAVFGISEALYELSRLAARRGRTARPPSCSSRRSTAALQDDREARKLQRTLRARGDAPLLIRVLRSRLSYGPEGEAKAALLGDLADALDATGKGDESLGLRLQALQDAPARTACTARPPSRPRVGPEPALHRHAAGAGRRRAASRTRRRRPTCCSAWRRSSSASSATTTRPRRSTAASRRSGTAWSRRGWAWPASPRPAATRPVRSSCSSASRARRTTR